MCKTIPKIVDEDEVLGEEVLSFSQFTEFLDMAAQNLRMIDSVEEEKIVKDYKERVLAHKVGWFKYERLFLVVDQFWDNPVSQD